MALKRIGLFLVCLLCSRDVYSQTSDYKNFSSALEYLETISSYGDFKEENEDLKSITNAGIALAKHWLSREMDSIVRSEFLYHSGRLYLKKKIADSSRIDLEQALDYNIRNVRALERLAQLATYHLKGYTKRKGYINRCVEACKLSLDSSLIYDWVLLAEAYSLQMTHNLANNRELIAACYRNCISLDSTDDRYYYKLSLYVFMKEKELALRKALSIREFWLYRSHLVALYAYEYKKYPEAIQLIDESIALYEKAIPVNYHFISTLYEFKAEICKSQKRMDLYNENMAKARSFSGR